MILSIGFRLISTWYDNIRGFSICKVLHFDSLENHFLLCLSWFILDKRVKKLCFKKVLHFIKSASFLHCFITLLAIAEEIYISCYVTSKF